MPTLSDEDIAGFAYNAGFRDNDLATAVAIALAESGGDPAQISPPNKDGTKDYGLFQINSSHTDSGLFAATSGPGLLTNSVDLNSPNGMFELWSNPAANALYAHRLFVARGGFGDWSTYNEGKHLKFMSRGQAAAAHPNTAVQGSNTYTNGSLFSGIGDILDVLKSIGGQLYKAGAWMAKPENWGRVALVVVGGSMVVSGFVVLARPYLQSPVAQIAKEIV